MFLLLAMQGEIGRLIFDMPGMFYYISRLTQKVQTMMDGQGTLHTIRLHTNISAPCDGTTK